MSLYSFGFRHNFSREMRILWSYWETMPRLKNRNFDLTFISDRVNLIQRRKFIEECLPRIITFMPIPTVIFDSSLDDGKYGNFSSLNWTMTINQSYVDKVGYGDFIELVVTLYHELRHAEQSFRVAQGLACGAIKYPDFKGDVHIQRAFHQNANGLSVVERGRAIFGTDPYPPLSADQIAELILIPGNVARRATQNAREEFDRFANSTVPPWCRAQTMLDEVKIWLHSRFTYSGSHATLDSNIGKEDNPNTYPNHRRNIHLIYKSTATEKDSFGIETYIKQFIQGFIGVDANSHYWSGRSHQVFGHLPS